MYNHSAVVQKLRPFYWRGGCCLLVELNREGSAPAAWAAGFFASVPKKFLEIYSTHLTMYCHKQEEVVKVVHQKTSTKMHLIFWAPIRRFNYFTKSKTETKDWFSHYFYSSVKFLRLSAFETAWRYEGTLIKYWECLTKTNGSGFILTFERSSFFARNFISFV